jgi:flagellar basal-body rod modification protein FlgD
MAINSVYAMTPGANVANVSNRSSTDTLGVDDFLQLMAAQLQSQSMYDQTDSSEFLAQLAQFTTLSQINELTSATKTNLALSLIGKEVAVPDDTSFRGYKTGFVTSVGLSEGVPHIQVNGKYYLLSDLLEIGNGTQDGLNIF